ncbi:hypothetical protein FO519_003596 [Halicephalobus sp. NKZ332]|nr:hypothetical protein FO519_003596 [Halicephalobus sp. NKZ332]
MDKSPLAMLEKTCETIGLPDTPAKKTSPKSKDISPLNDTKKKDCETIVTKSPRLNPISCVDKKGVTGCEPSTSMAPTMFPGNAMMQRCFPYPPPPPMMSGGPLGYPGMMNPFMMQPFMPPSSMPPMMMTPHMINGRPCTTVGCQTCAAYSMAQFMPTPDVMSHLSFLSALTNAQATSNMNMATSNSGKHVCNYNGINGPCGKTFASEAEHLAHLKAHVSETEQKSSGNTSRNPSPPSEKKISSPKTAANRFHPYMKDHTPTSNPSAAVNQANNAMMAAAQMQAMLMGMGMMPPMSMPPPTSGLGMHFPGMPGAPQFNPAAFQAMMAAQRGPH